MNNREKLLSFLWSLFLFLFFSFPLLWIINVSVQKRIEKYTLFPTKETFTLEYYKSIVVGNNIDFINSLVYSVKTNLAATFLSIFFSLSIVSLIKTNSISPNWKKRIFQFSIGLYFLPAILVYPGIQTIAKFFPFVFQIDILLIIVGTIIGYVIAFLLFMLVFDSNQKFHYEQLLLETGSRIRAFVFGLIVPKYTTTIVIISLTFITIWSEFYISNLISTTRGIKPFSVLLQTAVGQFDVNYTTFAVGAIFSFFVSLLAFAIFYFMGALMIWIITPKGKD